MSRDHLSVIYKLLPKGACWPREPGDAPTFDAVLDATAQEFDRVNEDGDDGLADFFPDVAVESLPDWERILGLTSSGLSTSQRQSQIVAQLRRHLDPSLANITAVAATWGSGIVVQDKQYQVPQYDISYEFPYYSEAWLTVITITYTGPTNPAFEAQMRAICPLHCTVIFVVA